MEKTNNRKLAMGLWKFNEKVSHSELVSVADEWAKDDNYILLSIRAVSRDQHGIGFAYTYEDKENGYQKYFHDTSDALKRRFGNDLAGWDIGEEATSIKGVL